MNKTIGRTISICLTILCVSPAWCRDNERATELFEKHIRPALIQHCQRCHGAKKQQGGLRVDLPSELAEGGDSGAAIVAGDPDDSLLIQAIRYTDPGLEMPPKGRLPDKTIAAFEQWVRLGAVDPRAESLTNRVNVPTTPSIADGKEFWAFQPISQPEPPQVRNERWPLQKLDRFVLANLEGLGIEPARAASRTQLLRRVYVDLTGLPPAPDQIRAFLQDDSPDAYRRVVDELLQSHHFGQRWGRHWLDVVRFAESSGGGRTLLFPNAWRYRDYVIDSLNGDVPFDQFVSEQIAGDQMVAADWQDERRKLIATGFLLLGPSNFELQDKLALEMDIIDEQLDTIGKSMLGMTIGCARCHDHKFDPIPTSDYYALAGVFKSTSSVIHSNVSTWSKATLPVSPDRQLAIDLHQQKTRDLEAKLALAQSKLPGSQRSTKASELNGDKSLAIKKIGGIIVDDGQATKRGQWVNSTSVGIYVGDQYVHDGSEAKGSKEIVFEKRLDAGQYDVRMSFTAHSNRSTRVPVTVHHEGGKTEILVNQRKRPPIDGVFFSLGSFSFDRKNQARVVISNRGTDDGVVIADAVCFIRSTDDEPASDKMRPSSIAQSHQAPAHGAPRIASLQSEVNKLELELKRWKASAPKLDRAMVVSDAERPADIPIAIRGVVHNTGKVVPRGFLRVLGNAPPNIPSTQSGRRQLAQWIVSAENPLTARVMANRIWYWLMGQGIVASLDNFGSMGTPPSQPKLLDHLASQFVLEGWSVKRLVRTIVLSRTYQMSTISSPHVAELDPDNEHFGRMNRKRLRAEDIRDAFLQIAGNMDGRCGGSGIKAGTKIEYGYVFDSYRRSVFLPVFRNTLPEQFEVFDFADPNIPQGKRTVSTVSSQALWMMNHPFVESQSQLASKNMLGQRGSAADPAVIEEVFLQVLGRKPNEQELLVATEYLVQDSRNGAAKLADLYKTLFQSIDFRYLN